MPIGIEKVFPLSFDFISSQDSMEVTRL